MSFISDLNLSISNYTKSVADTEALTVVNRRDLVLKYTLALMYYDVLKLYLTDTGIIGDTNIVTAQEIQTVIDKLNNIMGTYLFTDFN